MTAIDVLRNPMLSARKIAGRLRRHLTQIPDAAEIRLINNRVRFEHTKLSFLNEEDMRAMWTKSYDLTLCDYLQRHLTEGDTVIDVGANVGYISAFVASCVGTSGQIHGFEPLPECFARLKVLCSLNPGYKFVFNNMALGEENGEFPIAYDPAGESRNATLVPGNNYSKVIQVQVKRLDDYIRETISSPERIKIIKIDVEGFEFSVLRGLERFWTGTSFRPHIICEIKPWTVKKIGYTLDEFDRYMKKFDYQTFDLDDEASAVRLPELKEMTTLVFRTAS
jgi:FkbM family methyltransferase